MDENPEGGHAAERAVFWLGPSSPPRGLRTELTIIENEDALLSRTAGHERVVLCFGPGHVPDSVRATLETMHRGCPHVEVASVVLGAEDLDGYQELLDSDRLFYLTRGALSDRDLVAILESALGPAPLTHLTLDRFLGADTLRRLALAQSITELADRLRAAMVRTADAERGRVVLFDPERQALWIPANATDDGGESAAVGLVSFILRTGSTICLPRAGEDSRFDRELDNPGGDDADRFLGVPVRAREGEIVAVLVALRSGDAHAFEPLEIAAMEALAAHCSPYLAAWTGGATRTLSRGSGDRESPFREHALRELDVPVHAGPEPLRLEPRWSRWLSSRQMSKRIRLVAQTAAADCGAACLAMSLGAHGKVVSLEEVRRVTGLSRHGVDAQLLREAAEHFGLRARGVQLRTPEDLLFLDPGSILHWEFRHFVVLERAERDGAWILDPGNGRRFVSRAELDHALTGVALVLEPGPDFDRGGKQPHSLLGRYLKRVLRHDSALIRIVFTSILLQLFALAVPVLTGILIDRVIPRGDSQLFWILAAGGAALVGFSLFATLIRGHLLLALRTRLDAQLTLDFLEHLVHLPFSFFQQRSAGDLLMRLGSNATIREILTSAVLSGALDGLMVASYLALLIIADVRLGLVVAGLAVVRIVILVGALRRRQRLTSEALQAQAAAQSYEVQMLAGMEALKACGAERRAVDAWSHLFTRELNVSLARGRLDVLVNSMLDALAVASPVIVLLYGGMRVMSGDLSLGTMLGLAALSAGFLAPLSTLVANASQFQLLGSYLERLEDVLATPAEPQGRELSRPASFAGRVALEEVTFSYGPLVAPALAEVSFEVQPGQLVAVVGPSGSGKSTLAGLVAALLQPGSGRLLYDGRPLEQFPREWLRTQMAYVPQQSYLFGSSIRANIALQDPSLPFERVVEAAKLAEIHDEISQMPMGYETVLADGGASLSGGQRQRIALARALVGRPRVLILDEATSALDAVTEQKIQQHLSGLRTTRIVAAHRLSTIRDADRILVLDQGRVVEAGTHEELFARTGLYHQLVAAQLESADGVNPRISSAPAWVEARLARITAVTKGETP